MNHTTAPPPAQGCPPEPEPWPPVAECGIGLIPAADHHVPRPKTSPTHRDEEKLFDGWTRLPLAYRRLRETLA